MRKCTYILIGLFSLTMLTNCAKNINQPATGTDAFSVVSKPIQYQDWKLIWHDEFTGKTVDQTKWEYEVGDTWYNNELQAYTANTNNAYIKDGKLVIQAVKEDYHNRQYTSARLRTKNRGDWKFGRIEVRAKVPAGQGIWPAIWMLPTVKENYGGWPYSGEIDIMELVGHKPAEMHGTVHYGAPGPQSRSKGTKYILLAGSFADAFHTYAITWEKDAIGFWVDDQFYFAVQAADFTDGVYPFNEPFHLILNLAVGGTWPGEPDATTTFPKQFIIDYVRVYHRK